MTNSPRLAWFSGPAYFVMGLLDLRAYAQQPPARGPLMGKEEGESGQGQTLAQWVVVLVVGGGGENKD